MSAELFLKTLFHDKPDKDHILIWEKRKDKKVSYWFRKTQDAINHFNRFGMNQDTYVGCGTSAKALSAYTRCKAEDISGIPAAWLDVDIQDPVHSKPNLPENEERAMDIISAFPLAPTMTVHSGHGYQFWWVFKKFGGLPDQKAHDAAADLLHKFTWSMRDRARSLGYDLDMTFDLSRVFRIPGGLNFKDETPLPVQLQNCTENYYTPLEFQEALNKFREDLGENATPLEERKSVKVADSSVINGKTLILNPTAEPPQPKFGNLLDFDPKLKASWEHRAKFKSGDESPSAYDLSIASTLFANEFTEQEIVDTLIAFRRKNNLPAKLVEKYYERTLVTASSAIRQNNQYKELNNILIDMANNNTVDDARVDEVREKAKKCISDIIGIDTIKIERLNIEPAEYRIITQNKVIPLGPISNITNQSHFRDRLADSIKIFLPFLKPPIWRNLSQAMLNICEDVSAGEDTSNTGLVRYWLREYLSTFQPLYDPNEAWQSKRAFFMGTLFYIFGQELRKYCQTFQREPISSKKMGVMLKDYGFIGDHYNFKDDNGGYHSRAIWKIKISSDPLLHEFLDMAMLKHAQDVNMNDQDSTENDEAVPYEGSQAVSTELH
jgi:actin-related protein